MKLSDKDIILKWLESGFKLSSMSMTIIQRRIAVAVVYLLCWKKKHNDMEWSVLIDLYFMLYEKKNSESYQVKKRISAIIQEVFDKERIFSLLPVELKTKANAVHVDRLLRKDAKEKAKASEAKNKKKNVTKKTRKPKKKKIVLGTEHISQLIPLDPNNKQKTILKRYMDASRFCYNRMLAIWIEMRKDGKNYFEEDVRKKFLEEKKDIAFLKDIPSVVCKDASRRLSKAILSFARKGKQYFPVFHSKRRCHESFSIYSLTNFIIDKNTKTTVNKPKPNYIGNKQYISVPNLGYVRMKGKVRFPQNITSTKIIMKGKEYFALIIYAITKEQYMQLHQCSNMSDAPVGIDLGVAHMAVLSNGISINPYNTNEKLLKRQKRYQRRWMRKLNAKTKQKVSLVSKNALKAKYRYDKISSQIHNQKMDYRHKWTTLVAKYYRNIVLENLNVSSMLKKGGSRHANIASSGFYKVREMLTNKEHLLNGKVTLADRYYPSTRICSHCGYEMPTHISLNIRTYKCPHCGMEIDRDLNAAINLQKIIGEGISESTPVDLISDFRNNGLSFVKVEAGRMVKSSDL